MCTDLGNIVVDVDEENAPLHAANFLSYVNAGYYSGTVFHRVIADFMIQGGGFDSRLTEKATLEDIQNESRNGLSNDRGTIAAARTADPHSARSQFFINVVDNPNLDGSARDWGYTVFGRVTAGMDVVDRIAELPTRRAGPFPSDVPDPLVAIRSMAEIDKALLESIPEAERREKLLSGLATAVANEDFEAAIYWADNFRAACLGVDTSFLVAEAQIAAALDRTSRARAALDEFFSVADEEHEAYAQAAELYAVVAPDRDPSGSLQFGECRIPVVPNVPDGTIAELQTMIDAQTNVVAFMSDSESYLECLDDFIDDDDNDERARSSALNEYNRIVDITQRLGDDYNQQVRAFRARE